MVNLYGLIPPLQIIHSWHNSTERDLSFLLFKIDHALIPTLFTQDSEKILSFEQLIYLDQPLLGIWEKEPEEQTPRLTKSHLKIVQRRSYKVKWAITQKVVLCL
jgi:hypothetical protein